MQNLQKSKIHKYIWQIFWIIIGLRITISIYIGYRYIISLGSETAAKGGTYVEGIFGSTSYLPFLSTDEQSTFYQSLLFDSCSRIQMEEYGATYKDQLCQIQTNDNRTFTISIVPGYVRSDGTPVDIDDIFFSYKNIISENMWSIPLLNTYSDIVIEKKTDTTIQVTFPKRSIDNKLFFSYHILPRHILADKTFDYYQRIFAQNPVYTKCAQIKPQSKDINSLILDISKCDDSYLGFYQIKNLESFDAFKQDYAINQKSIVDAYQFGEELDGYIAQPIVTHAYTTLFFNTNSEKIRVRLRRALAGLINQQFYTGSYNKFIRKDQRIFNNFMSNGDNIEEFLTRITPDGNVSIQELEESGVKNLTGTKIVFNENQRRHAYYINTKPFSIQIDINVSTAYETLGIQHGTVDKGNIVSYSKTKKTASHTIPLRDIKPGLNTYTIYTKDREKVINIGSITLYALDANNTTNTTYTTLTPETTLTIIYQNTIPTQKVVQHLKAIFESIQIADFFLFVPLSTRGEMEEEMRKNQYDIAIIPIERGLKKDISPILKTDDPTINPSQYTNPQFTTLFEQYIQHDNDNKAIRDQIISIYTRDIPFMILGKQINTVFIKPDVYEQIFLMYTGTVFENTWRSLIYNNLSRARSMHIDTENIGGLRTFWNYIRETIGWKQEQSIDQTEQYDREQYDTQI